MAAAVAAGLFAHAVHQKHIVCVCVCVLSSNSSFRTTYSRVNKHNCPVMSMVNAVLISLLVTEDRTIRRSGRGHHQNHHQQHTGSVQLSLSFFLSRPLVTTITSSDTSFSAPILRRERTFADDSAAVGSRS